MSAVAAIALQPSLAAVQADFESHLAEHGAALAAGQTIALDGAKHYLRATIDQPRNPRLRYVGSFTPIGVFATWWHFSINAGERVKYARRYSQIGGADRRVCRALVAAIPSAAQRAAQREAVMLATAARAKEMWEQAAAPCADHPYLVSHRVPPLGVRQLDTMLLVPYRDTAGNLCTLERIYPIGFKAVLAGGVRPGAQCLIGGAVRDRVGVAEGWATAVSCHLHFREPVAAARGMSGLLDTAKGLRAAHPAAVITIYGDCGTTAEKTAREAAAAVGGTVAIPPAGSNGDDWNDFFQLR